MKPPSPKATVDNPADRIRNIREIVISARALAVRSVDSVQASMNFAIGRRIVEHEQGGEKRAAYGKKCWRPWRRP